MTDTCRKHLNELEKLYSKNLDFRFYFSLNHISYIENQCKRKGIKYLSKHNIDKLFLDKGKPTSEIFFHANQIRGMLVYLNSGSVNKEEFTTDSELENMVILRSGIGIALTHTIEEEEDKDSYILFANTEIDKSEQENINIVAYSILSNVIYIEEKNIHNNIYKSANNDYRIFFQGEEGFTTNYNENNNIVALIIKDIRKPEGQIPLDKILSDKIKSQKNKDIEEGGGVFASYYIDTETRNKFEDELKKSFDLPPKGPA